MIFHETLVRKMLKLYTWMHDASQSGNICDNYDDDDKCCSLENEMKSLLLLLFYFINWAFFFWCSGRKNT